MSVARSSVEPSRRACVVVTVAYRSRSTLEGMLRRIAPPIPIIVVDNSADYEDITDLVNARPMTTYIDSGGNIGFGSACNLAASVATHPFIAFVNPDAEVDAALLDRLVNEVARDPRCSSAGPLLVEADGSVRIGSGGWLPTPLRALAHATGLFRLFVDRGIWVGRGSSTVFTVEWVAGTCLVVRSDVFRELGGFASQYFLYQEDMDLGRRLHDRGYRQILVGDVRVRHIAGSSSAAPDVRRLTWLRASALVEYLAATERVPTAKMICRMLALGALLRFGCDLVRGRTARLAEYGRQAIAFMFPGRTLKLRSVERQAQNAASDVVRQKRRSSIVVG